MGEDGGFGAKRFEHLDLRRAVGDVILAADDMRDLQVDVVDDLALDRGDDRDAPELLLRLDALLVVRLGDAVRQGLPVPPGVALSGDLVDAVLRLPLNSGPQPLISDVRQSGSAPPVDPGSVCRW